MASTRLPVKGRQRGRPKGPSSTESREAAKEWLEHRSRSKGLLQGAQYGYSLSQGVGQHDALIRVHALLEKNLTETTSLLAELRTTHAALGATEDVPCVASLEQAAKDLLALSRGVVALPGLKIGPRSEDARRDPLLSMAMWTFIFCDQSRLTRPTASELVALAVAVGAEEPTTDEPERGRRLENWINRINRRVLPLFEPQKIEPLAPAQRAAIIQTLARQAGMPAVADLVGELGSKI